MPKMTIERIATIFGIILPLWGGVAFLWSYEKSLVKSHQLDAYKLDAQIERTEIYMEVIKNDPLKKDAYDLSKMRLGNLMAQRDNMLKPRDE